MKPAQPFLINIKAESKKLDFFAIAIFLLHKSNFAYSKIKIIFLFFGFLFTGPVIIQLYLTQVKHIFFCIFTQLNTH